MGTEFHPSEAEEWDISGAVPLEVKAGTMVVLHGAVVHFSRENRSERSRHAFTLHAVEGAPGTEYPKDNWLQRPANDPFRPIPGLQ